MKDVTSCFSQCWGQKSGSLPLLSLATDALIVRKCCWLLEGKATQPIKQQEENRSDNCILGINYSFIEHTFVTRNSNQTTRHSLLGERGRLGTRLWFICCCTQLHVVIVFTVWLISLFISELWSYYNIWYEWAWIVYITHNWSVGITIYRKVPSKHPWALAVQAPPKIGDGPLHGEPARTFKSPPGKHPPPTFMFTSRGQKSAKSSPLFRRHPTHDRFAVAIRKGTLTIGHVFAEISKVCWFFLRRGGTSTECQLTDFFFWIEIILSRRVTQR